MCSPFRRTRRITRRVLVGHQAGRRTEIENILRDAKHGAALRHLPSGCQQVNTTWMGCADRHQPRRLPPPAHRHPRTRRWTARLGHPGGQSHDRHPATSTPVRPRPSRAPRRRAHPPPATGPAAPHPTPRPTDSSLTRPHQPRTPPEPAPEATLGSLTCPTFDNTHHKTPKRSTS
jgi:hypothetical protein